MSHDNRVTAAFIIIGNEILSGRTQDANLSFLAQRLGEIGIQVAEARVIPDIEQTIIDTVLESSGKVERLESIKAGCPESASSGSYYFTRFERQIEQRNLNLRNLDCVARHDTAVRSIRSGNVTVLRPAQNLTRADEPREQRNNLLEQSVFLDRSVLSVE